MDSSTNGYAVDAFDQAILTDLGDRISALHQHREDLMEQVAQVDATIRRYTKAMTALNPTVTRSRVNPVEDRKAKAKTRAMQTMANSAIYAEVVDRIHEFAQEQEEFRQIEFREWAGIEGLDSGKSSTAFAVLRDQNILRVSKVERGQKYYRLWKEA
jgi:hypothetical protein